MSERNYLSFGGPSASGEYMVNIAGYDHKKFIPMTVSLAIADKLGEGWGVCNRGTRIEIMSKQYFYGYRDDKKVLEAVTSTIGEVVREGDVGEAKFALPMIQILDEEHHGKTGEIRFVKCAVLADTADHWTVKPVEKPHYDPEAMFDKNQRLDQALMRISKSDQSAEPIAETFSIDDQSAYVLERVRHYLYDMWRQSCKPARQ